MYDVYLKKEKKFGLVVEIEQAGLIIVKFISIDFMFYNLEYIDIYSYA